MSTLSALSWALRVGCSVHLFHSYIYEFTETFGESMLPTLNYAGDYIHANKMCSKGRNIKLGDMVIAVKPTDPTQRVCKRVTGMPGDFVLVDPSTGDFQKYIQVPKGHCWLTGDNLTHSLDSRTYGALPLGLIRGKIFGITSVDGKSRWAPNVVKGDIDRI